MMVSPPRPNPLWRPPNTLRPRPPLTCASAPSPAAAHPSPAPPPTLSCAAAYPRTATLTCVERQPTMHRSQVSMWLPMFLAQS